MERGVVDASAIKYALTDDGVSIAYSVRGGGPGTAVLSPTYFNESIASSSSARRILDEGRTVISFEPRCQGSSDRGVSDVSLAARVLDFVAVQSAAGVERAAIHAVGEHVWPAVSFASDHPDFVSHFLVQGASTSGQERYGGTVLGALRALADVSWEAYTEAHTWLAGSRMKSSQLERARPAAALHRKNLEAEDFLRLSLADLEIDISEELRSLACSVLVVATEDAPLLGLREACRRFAAQVPTPTWCRLNIPSNTE